MTGNRRRLADGAHHHGLGGIAALLATLVLVGACTWMPDAVNPVDWYKGTKGWITGDKDKDAADAARKGAKPIPGADKPFPRLSSVPQRPTAETRQRAAAERERVASGLIADRNQARYTDEVLGQGAASAPPVPAQVTPRAAPRPPAIASAAPVPPVMRAPEPPPVAALRSPQRTQSARRQSATPQISSLSFGAPPADIAASLGGSGSRSSALPVRPGSPAIAPSQPMQGFGLDAGQAGTVYFAIGSSRLDPKGRRKVHRAYQTWRAQGGIIRVIGHASSRTRDLDLVSHQMANFNVSLDRANAVVRELIRLGARPEAIVIDAASDSRPVFFEVMPSGEAGNRRAEIHLER